MQNKVLIIGGEGFLGRNIVKSVKSLHGNCYLIYPTLNELDLLTFPEVRSYFNQHVSNDISIVIVAAHMPYVAKKHDDFNMMMENVDMCRNIISALGTRSVKELIYISSIDVYKINKKVLDEKSEVCPVSYYGSSKLMGETLFNAFALKTNTPLSILRVSQIYGIGDNSPKMIPSLINSGIRNKDITIYGDGSDTRDFVYVKDVADIISQLIDKKKHGIFNITSGKSYSINEIANVIAQNLDGNINIQHKSRKKNSSYQKFNNDKLQKELSFKFTDINEGINKVIKHQLK